MTIDMFDFEEREEQRFEKKVWGEVMHVFSDPAAAISVLRVKKGFRCSRHYHLHRHNTFYVVSGAIEVLCWNDINKVIGHEPSLRKTLAPNEQFFMGTVEATIPHMFRVLQSGLVIEIYPPAVAGDVVDINDIVRFDVGGPDVDS